jgi:cytochrome P450
VLHEAAHSFSNRAAYRFLEPLVGRAALITSDEPEHLQRRRRVQGAFHRRRLREVSARALRAFEAWVDEALAREVLALQPSLRPVVLDLVIDVLLGPGVRERHPRLRRDLFAMMAFANQPFLAQLFRVPLPGTPWWRFAAARRRVDAALYAEIARHRARSGEPGDGSVLAMLLGAGGESGGGAAGAASGGEAGDDRDSGGARAGDDRDSGGAAEGPPLRDEELRDQAVSLVSAGFDTTTAALTWCGWLLCDDGLRERVADAVHAAAPAPAAAQHAADGGAEAGAVPEFEALWREALRLYPPAPAILRVADRDLEWRGLRLPAGALVALSTYHTHRDERLWREAPRVALERWLGTDPEWTAPRDPFAYLPFGYGARHCIGAGLARILAGAWAAALLPRARWRALEPQAVRPLGTTLSPPGGLPVRFEPLGSKTRAR